MANVRAQPSATQANETEIAAQPLAQAVTAFAKQTGLQVIYVSGAVNGATSARVPLGLTPRETLTRLLEGTGLTFEFLNERTIRIYQSVSSSSSSSKATRVNDAQNVAPPDGGVADHLSTKSTATTGDKSMRPGMTAPLASLFAICSTFPTNPACAQGATTATSDGIRMEEVVITAQKTSELLQKTAVAVTAVTADTLKATGTVDAAGLTSVVPSLQVSYNNSNTTFAIRGIGSNTDATLGDAAVAFHIDGVFQGRPSGASGLFYDIARVEVLRGPQGTLYGRNATGGAINVITNQPKLDRFEGGGEVELGNYGLVRTAGMVNAPVNDTVAVRAAFQSQRHKGYLSSGYGDADDLAGRLQFLFAPGDDVSLLIGADYFHQGGVGRGVVQLPFDSKNPWSTPPQVVPFLNDDGTPVMTNATGFIGGQNVVVGKVPAGYASPKGWTDNTSWMAHGELNWKIGNVLLTDIAAYHKLKINYFAFFNLRNSMQDDVDTETSNELRLSSADPESRAKWVLGAYYHNESQPYTQQFYDNTPPNVDGCCTYLGQGTGLRFVYSKINNPSYAAFGQLTFKLTDTFRLTGGLRYNNDHKIVKGTTYQVFGSVVRIGPNQFGGPNPSDFGRVYGPVGTPYSFTVFGNTVSGVTTTDLRFRINTDVDKKWTSSNWKAGAEWDVTPDSLAYVTVATGYKQGGVFAGPPPKNTYEPETLTAYELGSKNRFMDNRVQLNLDAFYYKYKNFQVGQLEQLQVAPGSPETAFGDYIVNAPQATEYGLELESAFVLSDSDRLDMSATYLHTRFDEFLFPVPRSGVLNNATGLLQYQFVDKKGFPAAHAPQVTGTISYRHQWQMDKGARLSAMVSAHGESSQWLTVDHDPAVKKLDYQKAYTTYQAQLAYSTAEDKVTYSVYCKNIGNEAVKNNFTWNGNVWGNGTIDAPFASMSPPRTYGLVVSAKF